MHLGTYQLGDRVLLSIAVIEAQAPTWPDKAPWVLIQKAGEAAPVASFELPPIDPANAKGLFLRSIHLDERFTTGYFSCWLSWSVSGSARAYMSRFEIKPGGHGDGTVIAIQYYHRPHAEYLVQQTDGGVLARGRNPRV